MTGAYLLAREVRRNVRLIGTAASLHGRRRSDAVKAVKLARQLAALTPAAYDAIATVENAPAGYWLALVEGTAFDMLARRGLSETARREIVRLRTSARFILQRAAFSPPPSLRQ